MDNHKSPLTDFQLPTRTSHCTVSFKMPKKKLSPNISWWLSLFWKPGYVQEQTLPFWTHWPYFTKTYTLNQKWKSEWLSQTRFQAEKRSFKILCNVKETSRQKAHRNWSIHQDEQLFFNISVAQRAVAVPNTFQHLCQATIFSVWHSPCTLLV